MRFTWSGRLVLLLAAGVLAGACEGFEDDRPSVRIGNTDAAGREQQVPAATRVDVGGDEQLQAIALAATQDVADAHPGQRVTWEASFYGRSTWGICLGSSEAAVVTDRAGWGIETCEKTGIRVLSIPIARNTWLAVSDRAAVRPDVNTYVLATIDHAGESADEAGVEPLDAAALGRSRSRYIAFEQEARETGIEPVVG